MRVLVVLGITLSLATAVVAQEETRRHRSDDSKYSFAVPSDWKIGPLKGKVFSFKLALPGKRRRRVDVHLHRIEGMRNALGRAHFDRPFFLERHEGTDLKLWTDPVPHLEYIGDAKGNRPYRALRTYCVVQRIGFSVEIVTTAVADWPAIRGTLLKLAFSLEAKVSEWPPRPTGFTEVLRDGYVYLLQPGVKKAHIARMAKILKKVEREFASRYGPIIKDPSNAGQIVVYKGASHVPSENNAGFISDLREGRISAIPLPRDKTLDPWFAEAATGLLFAQRFDRQHPWWLLRGEQMAMRALLSTGRKHPAIDAGLFNTLPQRVRMFDVLAGRHEHADADTDVQGESFLYYSLLRSGHKEYRKAFKTYLAGVAAYDWKSAQVAHLMSLDMNEMRNAAQEFRGLFKLVK